MHDHHADQFDAIEFGARFEVRRFGVIDDYNAQRQAKAYRANAPVKTKIAEAAKDGSISDKERAGLSKEANRSQAVDGAKELQNSSRDRAAKAKREGVDGVDKNSSNRPHEGRLAGAKTRKESGDTIDEMEVQADKIEQDGNKVGAEALRKGKIATAKADEAKLREVYEANEDRIGALEAEKVLLESKPKKTEAQLKSQYVDKGEQLMAAFHEVGGKVDKSETGDDKGWRSDDWKADDSVTFQQLADRLKDHPNLVDRMVGAQGANDEELQGKSDAEVAELVANRPSGGDVMQRQAIAKKIVELAKGYNSERSADDADQARIDEIDKQLDGDGTTKNKGLRAENADIRDVLSPSTVAAIDADNKQGIDYYADEAGDRGDSDPQNPDGTTPSTKTVEIDYSTPERRAEVLKKAQKAGLLPKANVAFDKKGNATYTVQRGDSFWRIADASDGRDSGLDARHFQKLVNTNVKLHRLRDPNQIEIGQKFVVPGRSIADLVKLLGLKTTEEVEAPASTPSGSGGRNLTQ